MQGEASVHELEGIYEGLSVHRDASLLPDAQLGSVPRGLVSPPHGLSILLLEHLWKL